MRFICTIIFIVSCLCHTNTHAQVTPSTAKQLVEILPGSKNYEYREVGNSKLEILSGNVRIRQGTTLFYTDSCVVNRTERYFEAFGNVHINDSDTAHVYANYLRYLIDTRQAFLRGNVKLDDGHGTLTTSELEYDVANRIGTYTKGGRVTNKGSVLTSREGVYYADVHDIYFRKNVELKDPAYYLKSDSLIYNTETQIATFIAETYMKDTSNRTIRTSEGFYNTRTKRAEFTKHTTIQDGAVRIAGNEIVSDDATGITQIRGNGVLVDTAQGLSILANEIFANKKTEAYLATKSPLMIIKQDKDSIYVTADTLFSARLTDLFKTADTTAQSKAKTRVQATPVKKDSTNRYFEAFRNVRVFSDSLQSSSDSLFYSFRDSTFQLFHSPVVWTNRSQVTGDTIYLYTKNKKAHRFKVFENSFLINQLDPGIFNQVKSNRMDGFFENGVIDSVLAKGASESIYYIKDKDSAYVGINDTKSDAMDVYFKKGDLNKVVFRSAVEGTLWPMSHKKPSEMRLQGFLWQESRRPKTWYELLEKPKD